MGFMDQLKKLARPYSDDEDDFEEEFEAPAERKRSVSGGTADTTDYYGIDTSSYGSDSSSSRKATSSASQSISGRDGKVVNIHTTAVLSVVLVKPDRFDAVSDIAEHLREKRAVVLNLESTNKDVARRLVDFLSGCAYALDGKIKKVAVSTYIITPYNVDIMGDLIDELENNGLYI